MKYFLISEFDSPDQLGSGGMMSPEFLSILEAVRESASIPFIINSGFRSQEHNFEVGGKPNSAHLRGLAVDIRAMTDLEKYKIVQSAIYHGVKRIFVAKSFIHLDNDLSLPHPRLGAY